MFLVSSIIIDPAYFKMQIYDRWGEEIFESKDINMGWNGTYKGRLVSEGTYVWNVSVKDFANTEHEYFGRVTVVR